MITSAAETPLTFSFCKTVTGMEEYSANSFWILFADSGLRTQAMNREGVRGGDSSVVGVAVPESGYAGDGKLEDASWREDKMPERIAMPNVPQPRMVRVIGFGEKL